MAKLLTAAMSTIFSSIDFVLESLKSGWNWLVEKGKNAWRSWRGLESETSQGQELIQELSQEDIDAIEENPEGFISRMWNGLWGFMREVMVSEVFCEQWSGVPHLSECTQPLRGLDCLGCGAVVTGMCSVTGGIVGVLGETFLTGGMLSALAKGARGVKSALGILKSTRGYADAAKAARSTRFGQQMVAQSTKSSSRVYRIGDSVGRGFAQIKNSGIFQRAERFLGRASQTRVGRAIGKMDAIDTKAFNLGWNTVDGGFNTARLLVRGNEARRVVTEVGADAMRSTPVSLRRELTESELLVESEKVLGRSLTREQRETILNMSGKGDSPTEIAERAQALRTAGFAKEEALRLTEEGLVGSVRVTLPDSVPKKPGRSTGRNNGEMPIAFRQNISNQERLSEAEKVLARSLPSEQRQAIIAAHEVGQGALGRDGTLARIGNYTQGQIGEKVRILRQAGLGRDEIRVLIDQGLAGAPGIAARNNLPQAVIIGSPDPNDIGRVLGPGSTPSTPPLDPIAVMRENSRVVRERVGTHISFPRTRGGRSNGELLFVEDNMALVQFTENGKKMHKRVPVDQLQRAQGLPVPVSSPRPRDQLAEMRESTRAVSDRLGTHISFPRTGEGAPMGS